MKLSNNHYKRQWISNEYHYNSQPNTNLRIYHNENMRDHLYQHSMRINGGSPHAASFPVHARNSMKMASLDRFSAKIIFDSLFDASKSSKVRDTLTDFLLSA